jgi:hypothetical protein
MRRSKPSEISSFLWLADASYPSESLYTMQASHYLLQVIKLYRDNQKFRQVLGFAGISANFRHEFRSIFLTLRARQTCHQTQDFGLGFSL